MLPISVWELESERPSKYGLKHKKQSGLKLGTQTQEEPHLGLFYVDLIPTLCLLLLPMHCILMKMCSMSSLALEEFPIIAELLYRDTFVIVGILNWTVTDNMSK